MKDKNYVHATLFSSDEIPHDVLKEWEDMPECTNQDLTASKQLIISFRNAADYHAFGELIGQKLTAKTKSVWFPKVDISRYVDKQYKYVEQDEDYS